MAIHFYNTLARRKEPFMPIKDRLVGLYTCGPTVYNYAHIGNLRAYVFGDLLKRYLKYRGYKVRHVMNITDVDDKIIRDSRKENLSLKEFTKRYTDAFFEDVKTLSIQPADKYPRATQAIDGMVAMIKKLLEKGFAYRGDDGSIYYDISKFPDYGKFAHIDPDELQAGKRVKHDEYGKEKACDFALWKAWDRDDGEVFWETELGKGRPGWHIECSVMSTESLGNTFDIHAGGVDLIFPHHQNEIAQSEAATGKKFVNYWLHNEHLLADGKKMSKSLQNFYTLRDLLQKGKEPFAIRYLLLSVHYRQQLNFTMDGIDAKANELSDLKEFVLSLKAVRKRSADGDIAKGVEEAIEKTREDFEKAMDDDLNISDALAALNSFIGEVNVLLSQDRLSKKLSKDVLGFIFSLDEVLGIISKEVRDAEVISPGDELSKPLTKLVQEREDARKAKDFGRADQLREKIRKEGFDIVDTAKGPVLRKF
ncbi:cysteine--tRNA ligase [Candidatus Woesearchaeota archaeon]|nr:cysteine--tRNA ligase [Candidatus Woesearchaeota archaeon]